MDDELFPLPPGRPSFVAIGDSFTEGLNDVAAGGGFRGWADRLAVLLAAHYPGLRYANLAVRGRLLREIVAGQVPAAAAMAPGLVSLGGGGNDVLRPGADPDTLAELFDAAVARLQQPGSRVLMFTLCDTGPFPVFRLLRGKIAAYNMNLRAIADARGCYLVDLWSMRFLRAPSAWSADRLHLTAQSHHRVALRCAEVLGVPVTEDWRAPTTPAKPPTPPTPPTPPAPPAPSVARTPPASSAPSTPAEIPATSASGAASPAPAVPATFAPAAPGAPAVPATPAALTAAAARAAWLTARRADARWARDYLAPWVGRRLHGTSSGDGKEPKRPTLEPVAPNHPPGSP